MWFIYSAFILCSFSSLIWHQNCFVSVASVDMSLCFLYQLLSRILFHYFGSFCVICIGSLSRYLLSLSSFANIFGFISSCISKFFCCFVLIFSFRCTFACFSFLSIFAYCRSFFIGPSCLISHPGFFLIFLFGFLRGDTYFITD